MSKLEISAAFNCLALKTIKKGHSSNGM